MNSFKLLPAWRSAPKGMLSGCALALLLCACDASETKKPLTQVAAKVNGEEISIHQINAVLSRVQSGPDASPDQLRHEVLAKLIDQQVLYAQAAEKKFDRDPKVMMLVDSARREIVARAYMDSLLAGQAKVGPSEVRAYYVENPALFSQRKIYNIEEMVLPVSPEVLEPLQRMTAAGASMQEIAKYLAGQRIEFKSVEGVRKAEQIPLEILPRLADMSDGKVGVFESGKRYYVIRVVSSQTAPISESEARPHIEVFLDNQQAQRMVAQEVKRLKANARIEYLGDFAKTTTAGAGNTMAALKSERTNP